jgi:hypothetical protein
MHIKQLSVCAINFQRQFMTADKNESHILSIHICNECKILKALVVILKVEQKLK